MVRQCTGMFTDGVRYTVSATDIVSLRSLRRDATSLTISRSSSGGNEDDMMLGCLVVRRGNVLGKGRELAKSKSQKPKVIINAAVVKELSRKCRIPMAGYKV